MTDLSAKGGVARRDRFTDVTWLQLISFACMIPVLFVSYWIGFLCECVFIGYSNGKITAASLVAKVLRYGQ
jgi:hypothetical protein